MTELSTPVIELADVERVYPGQPPIRALDSVSLRIGRGEMAAIIGPSGSGKSTLLNIMGTLDRPTAGSVFVEGTPTTKLGDRQLAGLRAARLGFVFQSFHLLESASALENVATGLVYQGVPARQRRRAALAALDRVGLGDRARAKPSQLSGGQRQRVAIARAIVAEPALVLADEPTGNLDTSTSAEILDLLESLNEQGATIVIITHDNDIANRLGRRIHVRDGQIAPETAVVS